MTYHQCKLWTQPFKSSLSIFESDFTITPYLLVKYFIICHSLKIRHSRCQYISSDEKIVELRLFVCLFCYFLFVCLFSNMIVLPSL